jgi:cold-inducible RNA-binding protein
MKLYVGNMPYRTTEDQIRDLFAQAGEVDTVSLITDRETGRPKGFGFVEMKTTEGGQEAIKRFNGYEIESRALTVNEARPREERPARSSFGGGERSGGGGFGRDRDSRSSGGNRRDTGYTGNRRRF